MQRQIKDIKRVKEGAIFKVTTTTEDSMTEQDLNTKVAQLQQRNMILKQQAIAMKAEYDKNTVEIADCNVMLKEYAGELPTIE